MTDLKRSIRCSNCGVESNFNLGSDFELNELVIHAKCTNCKSSLQINFNIVDSSGASPESTASSSESSSEERTVNLEEDLFGSDMLNKSEESIEDIIES